MPITGSKTATFEIDCAKPSGRLQGKKDADGRRESVAEGIADVDHYALADRL